MLLLKRNWKCEIEVVTYTNMVSVTGKQIFVCTSQNIYSDSKNVKYSRLTIFQTSDFSDLRDDSDLPAASPPIPPMYNSNNQNFGCRIWCLGHKMRAMPQTWQPWTRLPPCWLETKSQLCLPSTDAAALVRSSWPSGQSIAAGGVPDKPAW